MTLPSTFPICRSVAALRQYVGEWHRQGLRVALVPTMGALHAGHLSLVARGLHLADRVVTSVFVNPIQFGPKEDFAAYPRREAEDAALLAKAGAHALYAPTVDVMYPEGFSTTVTVDGVSEGLCGAFRPGHFAGVATVVSKLLLQAGPDVALFGEKDYQQLQVIRRMVRDLDIPVHIEGVPTVREADGLALSSRNAYLSAEQRSVAPTLHQTLATAADHLAKGTAVDTEVAWGTSQLLAAGFASVDYLEVRDAVTLKPVSVVERPARILVAAYLGKTRLIDNQAVVPA
ncbi:pantoate--beta-alanine ligase [Telmatospirillum sp.]|uniref:pantoate--beta-alanine ligase n=1 Tax=Telmatospirillum sp. TaxID=2079197 RepID=UPI00284E6C43|nr:pantoate--beta-alanine ligase [Telmatospirillum sp.]MDR3435234.1 pantoate--beta-alanine ligase [Telmatospirillum sp.]